MYKIDYTDNVPVTVTSTLIRWIIPNQRAHTDTLVNVIHTYI